MTFLHVDLRDTPAATLPDYRDYLDHVYTYYDEAPPRPEDGWLPSQWITYLDRISYMPGWRVEVRVDTVGTPPTPVVVLWFEAYAQVAEPSALGPEASMALAPRKFGCKVHVRRFEVTNEERAKLVVDRALCDIHSTIHNKALRVRDA